MERWIAAAERLLEVATMGPALPPKLPPQLSAHAPRMAGSLRPRVTGRRAPCSRGSHAGTYRARLRHTWSVNLPAFFPMPEGREFPDPPRCAFCDQLGRTIPPERPESVDLPRLVAGPGLFICERCVLLFVESFDEDDLASRD